ncbi:maleylpyruvate isomerase family mycothiol-dependent enzyme [Kitasatospora cathayae]|uniref:Maleylpyruvate isomerase family mycothiol-dependent enzyme n=1 Tax=Kitasatospora cathayae TaxID=3004092 RepID=A0ABY7PXE8_9ACTN|nr:maleylpyruvate isomerase family mycothiol-dependent enzyme [Kitasatospora sp. HUAS 3-15]WBP85084.1 maleylpyruvate isomerase family mycothiol-dependent enzyme [Kitasatospora sp. HUAS 3-15]
MTARRDPERPGRLLRTERETLLPLLRRTPPEDFERPTACPDWNVREVLAHCGAALVRIIEGRLPAFTPEHNAQDVAERADWSLDRILDELEYGMTEAGPAIEAAGGELDVIALGEWVHAGDVRDALGEPGAYEGLGLDDALALLATVSRERSTPRVCAFTPRGSWLLGNLVDGRAAAQLSSDEGTLIRMYTGRPVAPERYSLAGARREELVIYR